MKKKQHEGLEDKKSHAMHGKLPLQLRSGAVRHSLKPMVVAREHICDEIYLDRPHKSCTVTLDRHSPTAIFVQA